VALKLVLDTSAVVALLESRHQGVAELIIDSGERPTISFVTVAELRVGQAMAPSELIARQRRRTAGKAALFPQHPVDGSCIDSYCAARRATLRGNDAWIAAAAHQLAATLVTFDATLAARAAGFVDVRLLGT
jgi:predicted nucleic acid-binding protein